MTRRGPGSGRPARTPTPREDLSALRTRLSAVVEPVVRRAGMDLERVTVSRVGRRHRVQVVVDGDDTGLDAIAEVSREVSAALDAAEQAGTAAVPGEYVLEVSSPGVDRPLTEPRHWRRNVGRLVTVSVRDLTDRDPTGDGSSRGRATVGGRPGGRSQVTGRVTAADPEGVTLEVEGQPRRLPYESLGPGRVQVELRRAGDGQDDDQEHGDRADPGRREGDRT